MELRRSQVPERLVQRCQVWLRRLVSEVRGRLGESPGSLALSRTFSLPRGRGSAGPYGGPGDGDLVTFMAASRHGICGSCCLAGVSRRCRWTRPGPLRGWQDHIMRGRRRKRRLGLTIAIAIEIVIAMTAEGVPVRLTRTESRQRTRDLLISAAMRVFARDGYAGASVDAIAGQAGFTVGALYSNFATKQELFLAAFERHCADELAALPALTETGASREELLLAVTRRFGEVDEEHREWWQLWAELWLYAQRHPQA